MAGNHEGDQGYMFTLMVCNPLVRWGVTEFQEEFGVQGVNLNSASQLVALYDHQISS